MEMNFSVVITGATSGLGLALSNKFIEMSECDLVVLGRNEKVLSSLHAKAPDRVHAIKVDLQNVDSISACVANIQNIFRGSQPLHFIHSAGIADPENLDSISAANLEAHFQINTIAPTLMVKGLLPLMEKSRILFISSGLVDFAIGGLSAYSMSKSALHALQRSINEELKPDKAICGVLYPSIFDSPMQTSLREATDFVSADLFKSYEQEKKLHTASDVASFVKNVLLNTSNEDFKSKVWDVDNTQHVEVSR
jgi:NAD(P)-dependent dehydrogenase (short-subunit alcohol dehydrogenase family)